MSELVNKVAEILNAPVDLVQRSAEARAQASGISVDEVLNSWAGGESVTASAPKAEDTVEVAPKEEVVIEEETQEQDAIEVAPKEEVAIPVTVTKPVTKSISFANETMGIKINSENLLPKWLNFSFIIIPLFILVGLISSSNTQECGERGMLNVDRKSQEAVNCDGSPYEGKGVAATNTINYIALGQEVYAVLLLVQAVTEVVVAVVLVQRLLVGHYIQLSQHVQITLNGFNLAQQVGKLK